MGGHETNLNFKKVIPPLKTGIEISQRIVDGAATNERDSCLPNEEVDYLAQSAELTDRYEKGRAAARSLSDQKC